MNCILHYCLLTAAWSPGPDSWRPPRSCPVRGRYQPHRGPSAGSQARGPVLMKGFYIFSPTTFKERDKIFHWLHFCSKTFSNQVIWSVNHFHRLLYMERGIRFFIGYIFVPRHFPIKCIWSVNHFHRLQYIEREIRFFHWLNFFSDSFQSSVFHL